MLLNDNEAERLMRWSAFLGAVGGPTSALKAQLSAGIAVLPPEETLLGVSGEGQRRRVPHEALFAAGVVIQPETGGEALGAWACRGRPPAPPPPRQAPSRPAN